MTDASASVVWDGVFDPFGNVASVTGAAADLLMFPGQYYDSETQLSQNWFRDYDPTIGRYIQSDPIGLMGGVNTYGYADGNPLRRYDLFGLWQVTVGGGWGYGGAITYGMNAGQFNFGFYFGAGAGFSFDYDPNDSGRHPCGLDTGIKASADLGPFGLSSDIRAQGPNSTALTVPGPVPFMSFNALDPESAGNPTFSFGGGGYAAVGASYYFTPG